MKKTAMVFPVILFALILFSGCLSGPSQANKENTTSLDTIYPDCNSIKDGHLKDKCIGLLNRSDSIMCNKSGLDYRSDCYTTFALAFGNATMCQDIRDNDSTDICLGYLARKQKDPLACAMISVAAGSTGSDSCYRDIAVATGDSSLCAKIETADQKNYCIAVTTGDPLLCAKNTKAKDCYYNLAKKLNDTKLCANISQEEWKNTCLAVLENDTTLCKSLSVMNQDLCYLNSAIELKDTHACNGINDNIKNNLCYMTADPDSLNLLKCNSISTSYDTKGQKITDYAVLTSCYDRIARQTGDLTMCDKIDEINQGLSSDLQTTRSKLDACYYYATLKKNNITL